MYDDFPWWYILLSLGGVVAVVYWVWKKKRDAKTQREADAQLAMNTPLTGDAYGAQQAAPYSPTQYSADGVVSSPYGAAPDCAGGGGAYGQPPQGGNNNFAYGGGMYTQPAAGGQQPQQPYAAYPPPQQQQYQQYPPPPQQQAPQANLYQQSSGTGGDFGGNIYGLPDQFHAQQQQPTTSPYPPPPQQA